MSDWLEFDKDRVCECEDVKALHAPNCTAVKLGDHTMPAAPCPCKKFKEAKR